MNNQNIEESIRRSIAFETPDLFDKIASAPVTKLPEADYIVKSQPKRNSSRLYAFYTACTSFAILFAICFGLAHNYYAVDSIIAIDVNPSVEISLNKSYKVLNVKANNKDGEQLIEQTNFKNKNCDTVVSDLTESLSSSGYIDQTHNSILVSVSNSNKTKAEEVKTKVITDIKTTLNKKEIEPVIYNQSVTDSTAKKLERLAKKHHISFGKMKLIHSLIEKDSSLTVEELAKLPISQIPTYVESREIQLAEVISCDTGEMATTAIASKDDEIISDTVIPKEEAQQPTTTNPTETSSKPSTAPEVTTSASVVSEVTTVSESSTASEEPIGVVIPKTDCPYCSDSCNCPYCKDGCQKGCPYCDMDCPNYKFDIHVDQTTEPTTEAMDSDSGYEITEPDDITVSGSTDEPEEETSSSTEEISTEEYSTTTTIDTLDSIAETN